jgi:hypothetical protein
MNQEDMKANNLTRRALQRSLKTVHAMFNELIDRNGYVKINIEMINNVRLTMMQ